MNHHPDFEELLSALSREHVEALIVGAYAVMAVTEPRYTKDLDVWVRPTRRNAQRTYRALKKFGDAAISSNASTQETFEEVAAD